MDASAKTLRCDGERRRLRDNVPFPPAPAHHRAIVWGRERMATGPKLVADHTEHGTEARRVPQALEPLQAALTLADGLVRVLDAVVLAPAAEMGNGRHHDGLRQMSRTSPASSTARHSQPRSPLIIRQSSSRCQMFEHTPRVRFNRRAYSVPNRSVQRRMAS